MLASRVRASGPWTVAFGVALACSACGGDEADPDAMDVELTYCDAAPIIASKCERCHHDPPENGAPFSLLTHADTQVATPVTTEPGRRRWQDMLEAVEEGTMPYLAFPLDPPVSPLSCEEKSTLVAWLKRGAAPPPAGNADCVSIEPTLLPCAD